jgi:hypothetical protein
MLYNIPGYEVFSKLNSTYRAGGVIVYIKSELASNCKFKKVNCSSADVLKVSYTLDNTSFSFLCVYRNHDKYSKIYFVNEITSIIENEKSPNLFVLGDFNIDTLKACSLSDFYLAKMSANGLYNIINEPTRVTDSSSTCIDHLFFRSEKEEVTKLNTSVFDFSITDHNMILCQFVSSKFVSESSTNSDFIKNHINYRALENNLKFEMWETVYREENASNAFELFYKILYKYVEDASSQSSKKTARKNKHLKEWMTSDLLEKIDLKNKCSKKVKKNPNDTEEREKYKRLCKEIAIEIKICKNIYYDDEFTKIQGNSRKEWGLVNKILNRKNKKDASVNKILDNGKTISKSIEISKIFNVFFSEIALKTQFEGEVQEGCSCSMNYSESLDTNESFYNDGISSFVVYKSIMSLNNSTSAKSDSFSNGLLKKIAFYISDVLAFLFNKSMNDGLFPDILKEAEVLPLHKKGSKEIVSNYRLFHSYLVSLKFLKKL